jgi:ribosomal protein L16 Arg81 hydroxylase
MIAPEAPPEETFKVKAGRLLYVPRGTVHRTDAKEESWSLNICYSGTSWADLLQDGLKAKLMASPRWRATVTGAAAGCDPNARNANILPELIGELRQMLDNPQALEEFSRTFLGPRG